MKKVCEECQQGFDTRDGRKRFCSRNCSATFNNRARGGKPMRDCEGLCGNKLKSDGNRRFCSTGCRRNRIMKDWLEGNHVFTNKEFPEWLREILIWDGCSRCNWLEIHPVTNKPPLQIDHIDGNSTNHSRENIQVLCPNCHSLTLNYGALNKGNGKRLRGKRQSATILVQPFEGSAALLT